MEMSQTIKAKIAESSEAFHTKLWPLISSQLGGGRIVHVESVSDRDFFKQVLDMYGGIDTWHVNDEKSLVRGLATRMQRTKKVFRTITIRFRRTSGAQTEIHKRMKSLQQPGQWLHPSLVVQGYFEPCGLGYGSPMAAAIARMDDVIGVICDGEQGVDWRNPRDWYLDRTSSKWGNQDNTEFAVVPVESLENRGLKTFWGQF
jgi:hypothetical protein